jgi:hypothetical protein
MTRTGSTVLLAILLTGCDIDRKADLAPAPAADSANASPPPGDPIIGRWRAQVPDSVLLRRGACPFECCAYGEWALRDSASIFTEARAAAAVAFTMPDSTRFRADSGFVRVTELQLLALTDTVDQRPYATRFLPGDTVVVLDYVGEGHWRVWHNGRVYEVEGFWGAEVQPLVAEMLGSYDREWWAHITAADGRKGWLLIKPPMQLIGADQCGGPPFWVKDTVRND